MEMNLKLKKLLFASAAATVLGICGLAATITSASAYVACNREGDCWHTDRRIRVPGVVLEYHSDDWYFHQHFGPDRRLREFHEGRGYWRGGVWITL
jgi:hypothetical protein